MPCETGRHDAGKGWHLFGLGNECRVSAESGLLMLRSHNAHPWIWIPVHHERRFFQSRRSKSRCDHIIQNPQKTLARKTPGTSYKEADANSEPYSLHKDPSRNAITTDRTRHVQLVCINCNSSALQRPRRAIKIALHAEYATGYLYTAYALHARVPRLPRRSGWFSS